MAGLHVPLSTLRHSPRGPSTHDLGPSWIATPSMSGVLIPFLMPVYPGAFPTLLTGKAHVQPVAYAERSVLPIRGKGVVEKTTSTGTSKYSAIRNARYRLGLYSPRSR